MRYLTTLGAVVLSTALWGPGVPSAAQEVPSGSYRQSCREISMNGSTLYAKCKDDRGDWRSTQLQDAQRCNSEIGNNNGSLRCDMRAENFQPSGEGNWQQGDRRDGDRRDADRHDGDQDRRRGDRDNGAPYGSYTQSCQDIRTDGHTLQASCQKRNGQWRQSSLRGYNRCSSEIQNINGRLVCGR